MYETAAGFALFEKKEFDEIAGELAQAQEAVQKFDRFQKLVEMVAYSPFTSADEALENINSIIKGEATEKLSDFLTTYLPKSKKKKQKFLLGISEVKLGPSITEKSGYTCSVNPAITELFRGIRTHFNKFAKEIDAKTLK